MIPKIIHYSWFSGEPFPESISKYIEGWKKLLPDYEFVLWDAEKLSAVGNTFANEAVSVGKWAFAADFIRLYAVYNQGGIWLDTDIELHRDFDPFLHHRMFIGTEFRAHDVPKKRVLGSHCFGAEPGHPFLKDCLEYYEGRHFIGCQSERVPVHMRFDMTLLPIIQANIAIENYGYDPHFGFPEHEQILSEDIHVYPSNYFDCPGYSSMKDVVCIHMRFGAWLSSDKPSFIPQNQIAIGKGPNYYLRSIKSSIDSFLVRRLKIAFTRNIRSKYVHDDVF